MKVHLYNQESIDNWVAFLFYSISEKHKTKVQIYNFDNEIIRTILDEKIEAGEHDIKWNGKDDSGNRVPNGIYYYQIINGDYKSPKKRIIL